MYLDDKETGGEKIQNSEEDTLIEILSYSINPFNSFVSKPSLPEQHSIVNNREYLIKSIVDSSLKNGNQKRIIPILGETGVGKTFFLWAIKRSIKIQSPAIFFTVPRTSKFFYYKLYTSIIEVLGSTRLREVTEEIIKKWGANEKKYGMFRSYTPEKIISKAKTQMRYKWSTNKSQLEDIFKIIINHVVSPEKSYLAERWLLGEVMSLEDLNYMDVNINLADEFVAEQLLRLILDHVKEGIILMFDDLDNSLDIFKDPFFEFICNFLNTNPNIRIAFTCDKSKMYGSEGMMEKIPEKFRYLVHDPLPINNFSTKDILNYYNEVLGKFCVENGVSYENIRKKHPYFPLQKWDILEIWELLAGNPRDCIREIARRIDKVSFLSIQNENSKNQQNYVNDSSLRRNT